ncbi:MAG: RNA polymerase sigma factor [Acidobacteriaceae bacterium]|jgi:RNA polymerase sigma-70 factor (ECF subfamily)
MPSSLERPAASTAVLNELAFQRLYDANATNIHNYLLAVSARSDVADDLLQETFCRLLLHPKSTAHLDALELRRYLFRIATNLLRDRHRSGATTPYADPPEPSSNPSLENFLDIRAMLQHLKPRERELLWLAYVEGMDHAEISSATGLNRLSVRTLLFRARNKAKQFLAPAGGSQ